MLAFLALDWEFIALWVPRTIESSNTKIDEVRHLLIGGCGTRMGSGRAVAGWLVMGPNSSILW